MTYKIKQLWQGDYFTYGGVEWLILDQETPGGRALTKELIGEKPFDEGESKNWTECGLKSYLNEEFLKKLVDHGAIETAFVEAEVDLTGMDGATDYGKDKCRIAPLTDGQYKTYKAIIPAAKDPYWLVTPYSHNEPYIGATYTQFVRFVRPDGSVDGCVADGGLYGVRANAVFDPELEVTITQSKIDEEIAAILAYDSPIVTVEGVQQIVPGLQTLIRATAEECENIPAVKELKPETAEIYRSVDAVTLYTTMRNNSVQGISARVLVTILKDKL